MSNNATESTRLIQTVREIFLSKWTTPTQDESPPAPSAKTSKEDSRFKTPGDDVVLTTQYETIGSPTGGDSQSQGTSQQEQESPPSNNSYTSEWQCFIHLLKGYIGPGCLSLPWAFSQLGLWGGCIGCVILSYWSSYNCWVVVKIKRHVLQQGPEDPSFLKIETYPDVGIWAYGAWFGRYVSTCICVQQMAICTVFLSFCGANLLAAWTLFPIHHVMVITLALPAVLALSCLASLKSMAPFSAVGTLLLFGGFGLLTALVVQDWETRPAYHNHVLDLQTIPLALCAILYSFEGICLILPIEESMKRPASFGRVFWSAMAMVCLVFCVVASMSVLAFGQVTNGSITAYLLASRDNNENQRALLLLANTAVSLSVLMTYPLQMFPALELMGPWISRLYYFGNKQGQEEQPKRRGDHAVVPSEDVEEGDDEEDIFCDELQGNHDPHQSNKNNKKKKSSSSSSEEENENENENQIMGDSPVVRFLLVMITYLVAIAVPNVELLISLAGALAGSSTALLIPPLLEYKFLQRTCSDGNATSICGRIRCMLLLLLGFAFLCIGTGSTIADIIKTYSKKEGGDDGN